MPLPLCWGSWELRFSWALNACAWETSEDEGTHHLAACRSEVSEHVDRVLLCSEFRDDAYSRASPPPSHQAIRTRAFCNLYVQLAARGAHAVPLHHRCLQRQHVRRFHGLPVRAHPVRPARDCEITAIQMSSQCIELNVHIFISGASVHQPVVVHAQRACPLMLSEQSQLIEG